jgi:hypothetical protein
VSYLTVADELIEYADGAIRYFRNKGHAIKVEPEDLGFPYTPTFTAKLSHTLVICDVQDRVNVDRTLEWVQYARTCQRDTRVIVALAGSVMVKPRDEQKLSAFGVGVLMCSAENCYEKLIAIDQALALSLPELTTLPPKVRRVLAPAYDQFARGDWREGFKTACQSFELEARSYLEKALRLGKVQLVTPTGKYSKVKPATISRATQGQLAGYYRTIAAPNKTEAFLEQALARLNDDRVRAIHYGTSGHTEARLRRNVGQHMLVIINALKYVHAGK